MGIFDSIGPILDIGKTIAGNLFAEEQQQDSQQFNSAEAAAARGFNREEAEKQREWTKGMRRTAYQDTMHDLAAAGLNPMMAIGHGSNQSGPGAAATGGQASAGIASPVERQSTTAAMQSASQIEVNRALEERTRAEADKIRAEEKEVLARTPTHAVSIDRMRQQINESIEQTKKIIQETSTSAFSAANLAQQTINLRELIPQIRATVQNLQAHTKLAGEQTKLTTAQTQKTGAETSEINQRIAANLPALQAALHNLERVSREMQMPQRAQDESVHNSFLGSLSATIRALTGLGSITRH